MSGRTAILAALLATGCASAPSVITRPVDASLPAERRYVPISAELVAPIPDPASGRTLAAVGDWIEAAKEREGALAVCNARLSEIGNVQGRPAE